MRRETACVHSGARPDREYGGLNTPVYTSSAYEYIGREDLLYPRYFNTPNQAAVVSKMCKLEGTEDGVLFSSGMAAMSTSILALAGPGSHVVVQEEIYGGTYGLARDEFERMGIRFVFVPTGTDAIRDALEEDTSLIIIETPTNPLLGIVDIRGVSSLARERGITTLIDNTFATPVNQNPRALGIDVIVHSGTKYLGGHSDLCCGIALSTSDLAGKILALARRLGGSLDAMTSSLLERSLKTLCIRVERQNANALAIALALGGMKAVSRVFYPGLPDSTGHGIAREQMSGFGGMLSFELDGKVDPFRFQQKLELIRPAVSLGGVESTICAPALTSHAGLTAEERARVGVSDSLLRLSVGIEHVDDLIADIESATGEE